ncbi:unnamed protein product, partial [Didymodactylos carnosus]
SPRKKAMTSESLTIRHRTVERTVQGAHVSFNKVMAVTTMKEQHDHEKNELTRLNTRFVGYISRVKQIETENKQLELKLDNLRKHWGLDSIRLKLEFEQTLQQTRKTIDQTSFNKAQAELGAKRAQFNILNYKCLCDDVQHWSNEDKAKLAILETSLSSNQIESEQFHRLINKLRNDVDKYRSDMKYLLEEINRLASELDTEIKGRITIDGEIQTLQEQIQFLTVIHEQEMNELRILLLGHTGINPTKFYINELQNAIVEIRKDFGKLSRLQQQELENYYQLKRTELVEQIQRKVPVRTGHIDYKESIVTVRQTIIQTKKEKNSLQNEYEINLAKMNDLQFKYDTLKRENSIIIGQRDYEIVELRNKIMHLTSSYDRIISNKTILEFEISTYRNLLSAQEGRMPIKPPIIPIIKPEIEYSESESQYVTKFQRSAK